MADDSDFVDWTKGLGTRPRPLLDRVNEHLQKEIGQKGLDRNEMINDVLDKHWLGYAEKYGSDNRNWPAGVMEKARKESQGLIDTLTPPELKRHFDLYNDISTLEPEDQEAEAYVRKEYPDIVARAERGEMQTPVIPTPTPTPTPAPAPPVRQPVAPPVKPPVQKPMKPMNAPLRTKPLTAFEKAVIAQRDKWEKEGLFTPPSMQEIARERLSVLKRPEEAAIPLPEETNPTGAR